MFIDFYNNYLKIILKIILLIDDVQTFTCIKHTNL